MSTVSGKYDVTSRFLHWLSAVVILWATVSGLFISFKSVDVDLRHAIAEFNVSITFLLLPFFIWRISNALRHCKPDYGEGLKGMQVRAAGIMHLTLYLMVSLVLITGLLGMKEPFGVFHWFTIPNLPGTPFLLESFNTIHTLSSRILAVCVGLHILAVVIHQLKGVNILRRMM